MYRAAMQAILSELVRQERLVVINDLGLEKRNTKALLQAIASNNVEPRGLLVVSEVDDNLGYSSNNIVGLDVVGVNAVDPVSLVGAERVMITEQALQALEGWLA